MTNFAFFFIIHSITYCNNPDIFLLVGGTDGGNTEGGGDGGGNPDGGNTEGGSGSEDGSEDIAINCTSPAQALEFYQKTNVDALAVAIGNAHGNYKQAPKLRFDILEETAGLVEVPLVLHGGTGILPDDFKNSIFLLHFLLKQTFF